MKTLNLKKNKMEDDLKNNGKQPSYSQRFLAIPSDSQLFLAIPRYSQLFLDAANEKCPLMLMGDHLDTGVRTFEKMKDDSDEDNLHFPKQPEISKTCFLTFAYLLEITRSLLRNLFNIKYCMGPQMRLRYESGHSNSVRF